MQDILNVHRTMTGALVVNASKNANYTHIAEAFDIAVRRYGNLVRRGEYINGAEWVRRIRLAHDLRCQEFNLLVDAVQSMMLTGENPAPKTYHLSDSLFTRFIKRIFRINKGAK